MAITKYAIIDHVGSLTEDEMKLVYNTVYANAKIDGFTKNKDCFTMRKICQKESPYARKITDKMKYRVRYVKNPKKVYFIANKLNSKTETELRKWCKRNIDIELYDVKERTICKYDRRMMSASPYIEWEPTEVKFNENEITCMRLITNIYAPALGYPLSAPVFRVDDVLVPENYIKRSDHDAMVASGETHFTKPYTSSTKFIQYNRAVATNKEIKEFIEYLNAYLKLTDCKIVTKLGKNFGAIVGNVQAFSEFLSPDYIICPHCRKPYLVTNHKDQFGNIHTSSVCTHCDKEVDDERFEMEAFFEDRYDEDDDNYLDSGIIDTEYQDDQYLTAVETTFDL